MLMKPLMQQYNTMRYIKMPNLPQNRVKTVAISCEAGEAIKKLTSLDIECIKIQNDKRLPEPVNSHADLQLLHISENTIFCHKEHLCIGESEQNFNIISIDKLPGNKYPEDVRLNCTIIYDKIICNKKTVAHEVLDFAERSGLTVINVNQGYSRCSICVVNENAIITDDKSIFTAAQNFFNDAQLISKNSILLKGYDYGFIGGCCGKIDKDIIAFNGAIESHSDYKKIIDFLDRNAVKCIELYNGRLADIGGILPLTEYT